MDTQQHLSSVMMPISATYHGADDWESTGLDYGDYSRMTTHTHVQSGERRKPTPLWVFNRTDLRDVLCLAMEVRAGLVRIWDVPIKRISSWRGGTEVERLARAEGACLEQVKVLEARVKALCSQYLTADEAKRTRLAEQIEHVDTQVRSYRAGPKLFAGVVYHYYHQRLDSVGVGLAMGIKPPLVRQMLLRLNQTWDVVQEMRSGERKLVPWKSKLLTARRQRALRAVQSHTAGATWAKVAKRVGCTFGSLRKLLIAEGLYQPIKPGWDGKTVINRAEAVAMRNEGLTLKEIGKRFGKSESAVWFALKREQQGKTASERTHGRRVEPEAIMDLIAQGWTQRRIADHTGCHRSTIAQSIARYKRKQAAESSQCVVSLPERADNSTPNYRP